MTPEPNQQQATVPGDAWSAAWSFDRLILLQPQIRTNGLWKLGERFYAVCPDLDLGLFAKDGRPLAEWFDGNRAMASPISLASSIPVGALRIPEHTAAHLASLYGDPLTYHEMNTQLSVLLPKDFPDFHFDTVPPVAILYVAKALSDQETRAAYSTVGPFVSKYHFRVEIVVAPERFARPEPIAEKDYRPHESQGISLVPARRLPTFLPRPIVHAVEQDDDFWASYHVEVLSRLR